MQPSSDQPVSNRNRQLKRYGPLVAIAVIVVIVIVIVAVAGGGDDKKDEATGPGTGSSTPGSQGPAGALTFDQAKKDGTVDQHTFPHCDKSTGRVAMPYYFAAPCYADVKDNGGATAPQGVTKDTITVGVYIAQENDAVLDYITQAINNDDTNAQSKATYQGYTDMFNALYQTYGRKVELKFIEASGGSQDEVAARADAVKAAEDLKVFAVWGGPVLTSAFADELAARHVLCIGCTAGDPSFYQDRAPYLFTTAINQQQVQDHVVEYIEKKLNGFKAKFAGSDSLKSQTRKFGYLWIESNDDSKKSADRFVSKLRDGGIELAENVPYTLDPARLQEQATSAIAKFKQAGVTSIVFSGDPVAPSTFTKEATAQDYFPEWVLGPQALVDTNAFARTYDQQQWAHAFGPSPLATRFTPEEAPSFSLYKWFKGTNPPAIDTNPVLLPAPSLFFAGVQAAGPNLNVDTFKQGLFERPNLKQGTVTQAYITYGRQGYWDYDDYNGGDDMTEVWWDPNATGPDEIRKEGKGMWRFVDGGKRYLPGKWPKGESKAFDKAGTVTILDQPPADERPKDYPSPAGGG